MRIRLRITTCSDFFNGPAVQRSRYMTLESNATLGDDLAVMLPAVAA